MSIEFWTNFWTWTLVFTILLFAILFVTVAIGGWADIKSMLTALSDASRDAKSDD